MWYAIISEDNEGSLPRRLEVRPAHLERMQKLLDEGRVLLAGPHPAIDAEDPGPAGYTGSLVVVEFESLQEAEAWANEDPYVKANIYKTVTVKPFKPVLP